MKAPLVPLCITLMLSASTVLAAGDDGIRPIRPVSQCLRSDRISDWKVIDDQRLLVKSLGSRYYDIRLGNRCPRLMSSSYVGFRDGVQPLMTPSRPASNAPGQNPTTTDGRICGDIGDAVIPQTGSIDPTQPPCDIASIQRIDVETWKSTTKTARRADS